MQKFIFNNMTHKFEKNPLFISINDVFKKDFEN